MSIDFRIRDFFYPRDIWRLHRTFERNQWLSPELLEDYQLGRLKLVLTRAFERVPYYREQFKAKGLHPSDIRSLADLREFPTLSKEAVRENQERLLADDAPEHALFACSTSGSSGEPLRFYLDRNSQALEFVYYWRYWGWSGYRLGDSIAELASHHFLVHRELVDRATYLQRGLRRLLLNSNLISDRGCRAMAEALRRRRPRFLKGVSSALYFFALGLQRLGIKDIHFDVVFSTGDVVTEMHRRVIEDVFNSEVRDSYGHMERTVAASQCPQGAYHVHSDYGVLEVEGAGAQAQNGFGRVLGTSLHNLAMPLIRYEVGDAVELFPERRLCPCGRGLPLLKAIHGRQEDVIVTPDGRCVTALFIVPKFVSGIRGIQFLHTEEDKLSILLVPGQDWESGASGALLEYTRRTVGPSMRLELRLVRLEDLLRDSSGKVRTVVGRR
jgi:phenylacetate-CoA ligase